MFQASSGQSCPKILYFRVIAYNQAVKIRLNEVKEKLLNPTISAFYEDDSFSDWRREKLCHEVWVCLTCSV